jgi:Plasmid pRiA4b ORF-3-like protein
MAKKKGAWTETKSDFLRKALSKNPNLDYDQVLRKWAQTGHAGEISIALYYQVRAKLGIKTEWVWVKEPERGSASGEVYQLKITLMNIRPPIWRRIQVPDCTLGALHDVIQTVMGWQRSHMHQFIINNEYYGKVFPDEMDADLEMNADFRGRENNQSSDDCRGQRKVNSIFRWPIHGMGSESRPSAASRRIGLWLRRSKVMVMRSV